MQARAEIYAGAEFALLTRHGKQRVIAPAREDALGCRVHHVDGYDTAAATLAATWAREAGIPVIADLDELYPGVEALLENIDYLFVPVGGGGLASGIGAFFKTYSPKTKIIGVEPEGAPSMMAAFHAGHPITLEDINRFVDGAAVKRVGDLTYSICREVLDEMNTVPEGRICSTILQLYNENAIVVEPAGALSIAALDDYADTIKGKTVVCIVSGSNNDIDRMQEIKERSLQYEGLKHYFLIRFAQRPGASQRFPIASARMILISSFARCGC